MHTLTTFVLAIVLLAIVFTPLGWIGSELIAYILDTWSGNIAHDKWMDVNWPLRFFTGILLSESTVPIALLTFIATMFVTVPFLG